VTAMLKASGLDGTCARMFYEAGSKQDDAHKVVWLARDTVREAALRQASRIAYSVGVVCTRNGI